MKAVLKKTARLLSVFSCLCLVGGTAACAAGYQGTDIPKSQLELTITQVPVVSDSEIAQLLLVIDYYWNITPGSLSSDMVTVNWDPACFTFDDSSEYKVTNMVYNVSDRMYYPFNYQSTPKRAGLGSLSFEAGLRNPRISPKVTSRPNGSAFIYLVPRTPIYTDDPITCNFSVVYKHGSREETKTITFTPSASPCKL